MYGTYLQFLHLVMNTCLMTHKNLKNFLKELFNHVLQKAILLQTFFVVVEQQRL